MPLFVFVQRRNGPCMRVYIVKDEFLIASFYPWYIHSLYLKKNLTLYSKGKYYDKLVVDYM
jgi:hypothetical protein